MRVAGFLLAVVLAAARLAAVVAAPPNSAIHAVAGPAAVPVAPPADPFPLRRQFLSDDQLDRLTTDPRGPFRKLSKAEFEAKVRAATDAVQLTRTPPQVVAARYSARYEPGRLVGTAHWTVANPTGQPGLMPIDSLRLAVTEFVPAADRTALLFRGKPGGKELPGTFLWVGGDRETAVSLDWSARGVEETDEEKFDLGVPPAAIATLEITLAADRLPSLTTANGTKRIEATGPFPGKTEQERVWRWSVGGLSGVMLAVRPTNTPGAEVTATRTASYELTPGVARGTFDFTLDSPRGLIREQAFAVDVGVKVVGVTGEGVKQWVQQPADGQAVGPLVVTWREPAASAKLKLTTTSALGPGAVAWSCPGVRAIGSLPGAEVIDVTVSPELKLDGWNANDYRPTVGTSAKGIKVQFIGSLASGSDGTRRLPTVRIRSAEPEIATDEVLTWQVEPGRTRLSAVVKVKVLRGPLPQFIVHTAAGYTLESAALLPEDPAIVFGPLPGTPNAWVVEPSRAVSTGRTAEVRLEFRGPPGPPAPDPADPNPSVLPLPFPVFQPIGAVERQGTLTVTSDGVRASTRTVLTVTPQASGWEVKYRGKEPSGVGLFSPEPTSASVDAVRLAMRNRLCEATILGRVDDRRIGSLTVFVPHREGQVKASDGMTVAPLSAVELVPLLTATNGWSALSAAGFVPDGVYWRVTFAKSISGAFEVTTTYPAPALDSSAVLALPLPHVGGGRGDVTVELSPELSAIYRVASAPTSNDPAAVMLEPLAARPAVSVSGEWRLANVHQIQQIDGDGGLTVMLTGRVVEAAERSLDITLPPAAVVESAQVGGKWVTLKPGEVVRLPLPDIPLDGLPFEVRYRLVAPPLGLLPKFVSPPPGLPGNVSVSSRWQFARGWLPWPTLADSDECSQQSEVRVARSQVLRGVGFGLGGLVLALGVGLVFTKSRWRTPVVVVLVGVSGVGVWVGSVGWLKLLQPPLFAGMVVLVLAACRRIPRPSAGSPSAMIKVGAVLAVVGVFAHAQSTGEPAVVYVVGSDVQSVYAPPTVLDKLDSLATPPLPDVVVTRAAYSATADDAGVSFDATFTLECPRPGTHTLILPLTGVRLESMQLDGADAFPDASKPDRYTLAVKGQGQHTLVAKFAVMTTTTGGDREARFSGPEVHTCRVAFDAGSKGRQPDVPTRRGGQTVTERTVAADHGAGRAIAVRWRESASGGEKAAVSVKAAGVWDVTDSPEAGVWAAFAYRVESGGVDRFEIDIPAGLVAIRVLVRSVDPRATSVGVRGWRIAPSGDGTRVVARLQQPADGRVLVLVRAVPAKPLGPNPILRFPRPANVVDADRDSIYAVRFPGVGVTDMAVNGAIDFISDAIVKDFPSVPEFAFDKSPPSRVVKRDPKATVDLRPRLIPAPAFIPLGGEVAFTCGAWVEVEGAVRAGAKDSGFVEFIVPEEIELRDVRANGLAGWGRSGNKVQVWLRQPAAEVLVRWSGSLPATGELPLPRWSTAVTPSEPTTVRVRAADGFGARVTQFTGMKPKAGAVGETTLAFEGSPPSMKVEVTPLATVVSKPSDPPTPRPSSPPTPLPAQKGDVSPVSPTAPPLNPWPLVGGAVWGIMLLAVAALLRGWRWQPERIAAIGLLGLLAAGVNTPLGWCFAAIGGVGLVWRLVRWVRRLI